MKIVLIGPVPPPNGGISVHIKRIMLHLKDRGIDYSLYNESKMQNNEKNIIPIKSFRKFILLIPFIRGDVLHFHSINKKLRMVMGLYTLLGKKVVLTIHGESLMEQIDGSNVITRFLLLKSLRNVDCVICVNTAHSNKLLKLGLVEQKVRTIPAYIHPIEKTEDEAAIPALIHQFIGSANFLISANGSIRLQHGKDVYGIDQLIQLLKHLVNSKYNVCMLFSVLGVSGQSHEEHQYYNDLKEQIKTNGLENSFLFYEAEDTEFYPILKKSHLFIRPTIMDGYGVSIAEALHYDVPSIASDVCVRPEGTIEFQSCNLTDLINTVEEVMQNYDQYKQRIQHSNMEDHLDELLSIYNQLSAQRTFDSKGKVISDEYVK